MYHLVLAGHYHRHALPLPCNLTSRLCHCQARPSLLTDCWTCSAKALSKYTEMVDEVIRQQKDKLEAASDEARLRLREWDMPEALQVLTHCFQHAR